MIMKEYLVIIFVFLYFLSFVHPPFLQAMHLDLPAAQDSVGKRFSSKFCEAKEVGFSIESSSDFALNNTYLKFADFPDDENFIEDLWTFTIELIGKDCGDYINAKEELILRDFFMEEAEIASHRYLYLPH